MSSADALVKAQQAGLDLVEVSPNATPPVCRIMDFGKYRLKKRISIKRLLPYHLDILNGM